MDHTPPTGDGTHATPDAARSPTETVRSAPSPAPAVAPVLSVDGFRKAYNTTLAVADLSFSVAPGEVLGLLGPNGAGKTTTMRAVCGIIPPTAGTIRIAGIDVAFDPVRAKSMLAYVPDDPKLFDALTVWEHLRFVASAYAVPSWKPRAEELLEQFELTPKRDALAQELSRGMRQKTAICCAYLHDPKLVLLDEPLTGLDPRGIRTMKDSITRMAARGTAFVVSSHLLNLIEDLCGTILIVHKGRCLYRGDMLGARAAFGSGSMDQSLEDVFLAATEGTPAPPRPVHGAGT
jgi:ABC-2 type transport system ATP-binding protein